MASAYVFDAYGTLFDVHAAIARHRAAAGGDADRFSEIWRAKQLEYTWTLTLAGHYVDFWTLTERALDFTFARVPSVDRALRPKLLEAYLTLDAFPDARATLADLKAGGARLAILSNGSPRMLKAASGQRRLTSGFCSIGRRGATIQAAAGSLRVGHQGNGRQVERCRFRIVEPLGRYGRGVFRLQSCLD
jgi:2-haloalkanoic acid dehalogenase type II